MNNFTLNIFPKEKDAEELFIEIEKINKDNQLSNLLEMKNIFIKIKNDYISNYKNIFISKEIEKKFFTSKIYELLKLKNNKQNFYTSLIPILI